MAISTILKTKRDGSLLISDNAAGNSLTVEFEAGDLTIDIPQESVINGLDRGRIGATPSLRYGDDQPITFSFTAYLRDLSDATYATLEEIVTLGGDVGANWVSTMGATGEVFTLDLKWTIEGTDHGDAADHTLTLNYCTFRGSFTEGDPNTINISGTSYMVRPTVT